jgi:hydroxymethylbilane synthase
LILRAATRGSPLALWQTRRLAQLLSRCTDGQVEVLEVVTETTGDRRQDVPIHQIGGQGVFAKEVQAAVLDGRADLAVHSAKDLPPRPAPGLALACVPERGDPRDALVGRRLDELSTGARVATGSVRRRAQLAWLRPDLSFVDLRGNIATRLARLDDGPGEIQALVMAAAALERLEIRDRMADVLAPERLLPQVGQGALAVECRAEDQETLALLARVEHGPSRRQVDAERAFLDELGGACDLPVGALGRTVGGELVLEGMVASGEGRVVLRHRGTGVDAAALGRQVATELLDRGGAELLGRR